MNTFDTVSPTEIVNKTVEALQHFELYSKAKDSLTKEENIRKGVEAEMNFEFDKRAVVQKEELEKKDILLKEQSKQNKMQLFFCRNSIFY